jgi:hypothetical protein
MPFDLGQTINGWVCSNNIIYNMASNPIITSLLLTAIILVIVYALFNSRDWKTVTRCGIYIFLTISLIVFVHYYALGRALRSDSAQKDIRDIVGQVTFTGANEDKNKYPVTPGSSSWTAGQANVIGGSDHGLRWREDSFRTESPKLVTESCDCPLKTEERPDNIRVNDLGLQDVIMPSARAPFAQ